MPDPAPATPADAPADLSNLQQTSIAASTAKVQEYNAALEAMANGDLDGQARHFRAYTAARDLDLKAEALLEADILNTPDNQRALASLLAANKTLCDTTAKIAAATTALDDFLTAVDAVTTILSVITKV